MPQGLFGQVFYYVSICSISPMMLFSVPFHLRAALPASTRTLGFSPLTTGALAGHRVDRQALGAWPAPLRQQEFRRLETPHSRQLQAPQSRSRRSLATLRAGVDSELTLSGCAWFQGNWRSRTWTTPRQGPLNSTSNPKFWIPHRWFFHALSMRFPGSDVEAVTQVAEDMEHVIEVSFNDSEPGVLSCFS